MLWLHIGYYSTLAVKLKSEWMPIFYKAQSLHTSLGQYTTQQPNIKVVYSYFFCGVIWRMVQINVTTIHTNKCDSFAIGFRKKGSIYITITLQFNLYSELSEKAQEAQGHYRASQYWSNLDTGSRSESVMSIAITLPQHIKRCNQ